MSTPLRSTVHQRDVRAPAGRVYPLIADASLWPAVFAPTVAVHHLLKGEREERFRIWALVNGAVSGWTSRRALDPDGLRVTFEQERSRPPVLSMSGSWTVRPSGPDRSTVELRHEFVLDDGPAEGHEAYLRALDGNSERELAALAEVAEIGDALDVALQTFESAVTVRAGAEEVYEFVARADLWPERLPHVRDVQLREDGPGIQDLDMETITVDGGTHRTRSHRVCERPAWIAYKQVVLPETLRGHSGVWSFQDDGKGWATAVSRHTVLLDPRHATPEERDRVRALLEKNSQATLLHATSFAGQDA
ncbi:aromatase/cyclase [Actinomadura chibensis]|uniref:Cyclase n=1 Tax=Actinomadura chibensis TaxID=392828 RepID=A0A5D0NUB8_9ACTN|nr:aromatase/cyclase [Actinomadura chibensis]TYB47977.1 cyclase [Actinomadura chibensis]